MRRRRSLKSAEKIVKKKPSTLAEVMKIALLIHEDGLIWVFHDKKIPGGLDWVDYDPKADKIYFINKEGFSYDLGLKMKAEQKQHLLRCEYLMSAHIEDNDVQNMNVVSFIPRRMN